MVRVAVKVFTHGGGLPLPSYASPGSAGVDLFAAVDDALTIQPHTTAAVPTGLAIAIPDGYEGQVRPRSGLALKHNIGIINAPGTIDSDYRGEVMALLTNFGDQPYTIHRGDRIAQLVIAACQRLEWDETDDLPNTPRGSGGFGHSGK